MPLVYGIKYDETYPLRMQQGILLHDYNRNALKLFAIRHNSPPQYFVQALEDLLEYLLTYHRTEEIHKLEMALKQQDFLYKDALIVERIVYLSKFLHDKDVPPQIKHYVSNSLLSILKEQENLHRKMGMTPTITRIDTWI